MGKTLVRIFIVLFCCGSFVTWVYFLAAGKVAGKIG